MHSHGTVTSRVKDIWRVIERQSEKEQNINSLTKTKAIHQKFCTPHAKVQK